MSVETIIGIVEDDASQRSSLVRLVRSMGYAARGFASAEEFMDSDAVSGCSCLITDVQMPGISGIELTRFMTDRCSKLPVIVVTARSEPGLEISAIANGAAFFQRKPLDIDLLVSNLRQAVGS